MNVIPERVDTTTVVRRSKKRAVSGNPYFIGLNKRAMVSLGPLKGRRNYCSYKCAFCYVQGPFPQYEGHGPREIVDWLRQRIDQGEAFDVVYVSGDTDSFARPRTPDGLELLELLLQLEPRVDVLFTTRYAFTAAERARVADIVEAYQSAGAALIPCVSISQLNFPELEPPPVPSPQARLDQVQWLHELCASVILTVRPFIPYLPAEEYVEIVRRNGGSSSLVLGGDWHTDLGGVIDGQTRRALAGRLGSLVPLTSNEPPNQLDFCDDGTVWHTHRHPRAIESVDAAAGSVGLPFYMRSGEAVDLLRGRVHGA